MWCYRSSVIKHNPCVISYEHWVFKSLLRLNAEKYIKPNHNIVCLRYTYKVKLTFFGNNVGLNPTVMYVCNFVLYFLFIVFFFVPSFIFFKLICGSLVYTSHTFGVYILFYQLAKVVNFYIIPTMAVANANQSYYFNCWYKWLSVIFITFQNHF